MAQKAVVKPGTRKGIPNKTTSRVADLLKRMGCDPFEGMANIALNQVPCGVCRGKLRTKYALPAGDHTRECRNSGKSDCICDGVAERICQSCYGSGMESCSPEIRGKMCAELAQYVACKRRSLEVTGDEGGPVGMRLVIEFAEPAPPEIEGVCQRLE